MNAAGVTDQDTDDPYDAMLADVTITFATNDTDPCLRAITPIPTIQGSGSSAAVTGAVTTRGVVVGDYEGPSPAQRGFFLQAATGDGDPATSDGIFVFNGNSEQRQSRRPRHRERQRRRLPGPDADLGDADHRVRHRHGRRRPT